MKEGDFSLFKNTKKTEESHPDYTGKCMVNSKELRVAAWIKKGESGLAFFSGRISEFQHKTENIGDPLNPETNSAKIYETQIPAQVDEFTNPIPEDDLPF